ncbi:hypothetical protein [Roseateles sp.]|uniref:hypothetical protein n=1 Tax=Roseateles sp. TaxID=1971397 RepID=UPI003D140F74
MSVSTEALQIIGAVTVAMIAGLASFIVTILTKEQKTSEFRQSWIDSLRQELSDFAAILISIADAIQIRSERGESGREISDQIHNERFGDIRQLEGLRVRILLRLNPDEHQDLIALVDKAYLYNQTIRTQDEDGGSLIKSFTSESQRVLKEEWRRVKRGELAFLLTKWGSFGFFMAATAVTVVYATGHLYVAYVP